MTSGAIQQGEPTKVFLFYPFFKEALTPKSEMKIFPFISRRILPALTSLWIYPFLCRYYKLRRVSFSIVAMIASSLIPEGKIACRTSAQEPPPSKGITIHKSCFSMKEQWCEITFLCWHKFITEISFRMSSIEFSENCSRSITLIATP